MDAELTRLLDDGSDDSTSQLRKEIAFTNEGNVVEVQTPEGKRSYALKSIAELYGDGNSKPSIEPTDDTFAPLFLSIEQAILNYWRSEPSLTDGQVSLTLDRLGMSPEAEPGDDSLAAYLQRDLRLLLSLNNYSRQEVRATIRKIGKTLARHTRIAGPRGYLSFIREYVPA
jgi:hypothetical protein